MSCPYYSFDDHGRFFGGQYHCNVTDSTVNDDTYYSYCRGYNYDACPNYKSKHSSGGGCYITSACIYAKCLPDDCHELQTLRSYRDSWLRGREEGEEMIREYYRIAPEIVSNINDRPDKKEIYERIYEKMILPCVRMIEAKKYEDALVLYRETTLKLKNAYV